jgi:hypothetical protein
VAAKLRKTLGIDVRMVAGHYGEFKVLVDDEVIVDAGARAALGILPRAKTVIEAVRAKLAP